MSVFSSMKIGSEKYPALTGIRAFGAAVVFFDHFPLWKDAHLIINVMAFFYALSGFLIVRIYYQQVELSGRWLSKYFLNRFARIYPVYFLLLSIAVWLRHDYRPWMLLKNYTLTHALFPSTDLIIQPSWSLTVEECFYFLAPLFMILARRRNFWVSFALGGLLLALALGIAGLHGGFLGSSAFVLSTTFFGHFVEFFAGVYLALAVIRLEKRGPLHAPGSRWTLAGLAGVSVLIFAMLVVYRHAPLNYFAIILINNFLIPVPIALLYCGLIRENTTLARLLSGRTAGLLGRSSYSFYLLHILIIDYVSIPFLLPLVGSRPAVVLLSFVLTWLIAVFLFVFFEEPVNLFVRRRFHSKDRSVGMQETLFQVKA